MPSYFDPSYISAVQSIYNNRPDYLSMFSKGMELGKSFPWSPENQRKRQMEDFQMAQQQAKFAADMQDHQRNSQLQDILMLHKTAQEKRMALGLGNTVPGGTGAAVDQNGGFNAVMERIKQLNGSGASAPKDQTALPMPDMNSIPDSPEIPAGDIIPPPLNAVAVPNGIPIGETIPTDLLN